MLYNYLALVFFASFGILVPAAYLFLSRLLRNTEPGNLVKNAPFESAEESLGVERSVTHEYLPYFMLFLPFDIVLAMLLFWSSVSAVIPTNASMAIVILVVVATMLAGFGYKIASGTDGR